MRWIPFSQYNPTFDFSEAVSCRAFKKLQIMPRIMTPLIIPAIRLITGRIESGPSNWTAPDLISAFNAG
jgi:hypothetical protein